MLLVGGEELADRVRVVAAQLAVRVDRVDDRLHRVALVVGEEQLEVTQAVAHRLDRQASDHREVVAEDVRRDRGAVVGHRVDGAERLLALLLLDLDLQLVEVVVELG